MRAYLTAGCLNTGGVEVCGNCLDDDGNGLTDFEDPACCSDAHRLRTAKSRLRIVPGSAVSRLRRRALLARAGLAFVDPSTEDVLLQIRAENQASDLPCARVPAERFSHRQRTFKFRDPENTRDSARGLARMTVRIAANGSVRFRNRTSDAESRCSAISQGLRPTRTGGLRAP